VPFSHYRRLMVDPSLPNVRAVARELPRKNYLTLMFLLDFLISDVVPQTDSNKMTSYGLAVCFSQSLMRAEVATEEALQHSKTAASVVALMMAHFGEIFEESKLLLSQLMEDHKQEFE
jgi:hypothetical protein